MQSEFENILLDTQKEYRRSNRMKDKIIVVLIVLMFLEAIIGYCGFVWYESQFDYVTTEQTTQDIDLSTEGDNASAEYNDVQGNQYNDNATHKSSDNDNSKGRKIQKQVWWKFKQMSDLWQVYREWFTWTNIMRKQERN